jgi:hypothetical protein
MPGVDSHACDPEVAVQLICWFPPDPGTVVVALFAAGKAGRGDVFYDGVATLVDPLIDQWKREAAHEEEARLTTKPPRPASQVSSAGTSAWTSCSPTRKSPLTSLLLMLTRRRWTGSTP